LEEELEQSLLKRIRYLTHALIISGAINIALVATLISFAVKRNFQSDTRRLGSFKKDCVSISKTNHGILNSYFSLSFGQLLDELRNTELLEDGYRKRDLALSYLAAFHFFDVEKALPGIGIQKRRMQFFHQEGGERLDLIVFPGLNDDHYQALLYFAHVEKWPFTTEGLFYELLRRKEEAPQSLIDAFYMTEEFHSLHCFIAHTTIPVKRESLLSLLLEGPYEMFHDFSNQFKEKKADDVEVAREFLLSYVRLKSKIAADLLIQMDAEFALRKLTDKDLAILIDMISEKHLDLERFLKELAYSVRSDFVRHKAGMKLYALVGGEPPSPYDHSEALKRFVPAVKKTQIQMQDPFLLYQGANASTLTPKSSNRTHQVKEGETLWKISRRYKIDVETLIQANNLESEYALPVGKELVIP